MTSDGTGQTITVELDEQEALVLFEWLYRLEEQSDRLVTTALGDRDPTPLDAATQHVLWNIETEIETTLGVLFASDYDQRLSAAIEELRVDTSPDDE